MAPMNKTRRGKRPAPTAVAETAAEPASDAEQPNDKPVKLDAKKAKVAKNAKPTVQNDIATNGDEIVSAETETKSKRVAAKKTVKQIDQIETSDENTVPIVPKRAAAKKKNVKQSEENDADTKDDAEAAVNGAGDDSGKPSAKERKKKVEAPKVEEPKASKGKPKKVEAQSSPKIDETAANKTDKKATKAKSTKKDDKPKEVVEKARSKRGAKKAESPKKPADTEKPANRRGRKAADEAKSAKQTEENTADDASADENNDIDSPKKAKGRGRKAADRAKSTKTMQDEETADEENEAAPAKGKGKKGAVKAKATSKSEQKEEENTAEEDDATVSEENTVVDSPKGRKRKPANAIKSPAKRAKGKSEADLVDGGLTSKANGSPKKRKVDTKASADSTTSDNDELVTKRKKTSKAEAKEQPAKSKLNPTATDLSQINFQSDKEFNLKIVSWNVAGLRSMITKNGFDYFNYEEPDIICLQEIKCLEDQVPEEAKLKGYHPYWCSTEGGHGGVAILTKSMPYSVEKNIGDAEMDAEGRIITAEYSKYFLVCVYVPNAGRKLCNLDRRLKWNEKFEDHVNKLKAKKPVIIVGDLNVAHEEIDLANPKSNRKNAGFSDDERAGMTDLLQHGFIDTFRDLHPDQDKAYTFWTYMQNSRQKNVGWRLDYSLVSENLKSKVVDSFMRPEILGSDHCPIVLLMNV